jgi:hypothetical protein
LEKKSSHLSRKLVTHQLNDFSCLLKELARIYLAINQACAPGAFSACPPGLTFTPLKTVRYPCKSFNLPSIASHTIAFHMSGDVQLFFGVQAVAIFA